MEFFSEHYESMRAAVLKYMPGADMDLIEKAVAYAQDKHKDQKRKDGSPYVTHAIAAATIAAQMGLDSVQREIRSFSGLAGAVVMDEMFCYVFVQPRHAECHLYLTVFDSGSQDVPFLRFINGKLLIRADFIASFPKFADGLVSLLWCVKFVAYNGILPTDVTTTTIQGAA